MNENLMGYATIAGEKGILERIVRKGNIATILKKA